MFCENCGKMVKDDAVFCPNCGQKVQPMSAVQSDGGQMRQTQILQENTGNAGGGSYGGGEPAGVGSGAGSGKNGGDQQNVLLIILGALIGILPVVIIGFGILMFQSHKEKDETSTLHPIETTASNEDDSETDSDSGKSNGAGTSENESSAVSDGAGSAQEASALTGSGNSANLIMLSESTTEGQLQRRIVEMNDGSHSLQSIDIYADNYSAGTRNNAYQWDDKVFYTMEGFIQSSGYYNKNLCQLVKKELINAVNGNIIDYEIYINPSTGIANKIVSIEYLSNGIEVTEYYFDNNAKISFMFQYQADNYVSTYATPDKKGQRFLFCNDTLVTWRVINDSTMNYVIGSNEAERLKASWAVTTIAPYSTLDSGSRQSYDNAEQKMIDAAYNTYNTVMNAEGIARITGYVYDANSNEYSGAKVDLYSSDFKSVIYSATTGSDGGYTIYVPNESYDYNIYITAEGKTPCSIYSIGMDNGQIGSYQDSVYLFDSNSSYAPVKITLGDAFTYNPNGTGMMMLQYAMVNVREGINNRSGNVVYQNTTDGNGYIYLELKPGVYTIEVISSGYETMYYTVVVSPINDNTYEFYAAPTLPEDEYAIVLTWGRYPYDLDSHLFTTRSSSTDHIWFGDKNDQFGNYLDVDDTNSYGPETVTIRQFNASDYYKYAIVDYTNCSSNNTNSSDMSNSGATVSVYSSQGLVGSYHVPTNTPGVIWEVFEIRQGVVTPIQRYYNNVVDKDWWHSEK